MEVLGKVAVADITKLVDECFSDLRLEICRSQKENESLKTKLQLMENELQVARSCGAGLRERSVDISLEVKVCDRVGEDEGHLDERCGTSLTRDGESVTLGKADVDKNDLPSHHLVIKCESADTEHDWPESQLLIKERCHFEVQNKINGETLWGDSKPTGAHGLEEGISEPQHWEEEQNTQFSTAEDPGQPNTACRFEELHQTEASLKQELEHFTQTVHQTGSVMGLQLQSVWSEATGSGPAQVQWGSCGQSGQSGVMQPLEKNGIDLVEDMCYMAEDGSILESHNNSSGSSVPSRELSPVMEQPSETEAPVSPQKRRKQACSPISGNALDSRSVSTKPLQHSPGGPRVFSKKQYCLYCQKPYLKIARHLEFIHWDKPDVAKAIDFPKRSKERKIRLRHLRNRGNLAHNLEVMRKGAGEITVCRRTRRNSQLHDFIPCIYCQGLYSKVYLWKHLTCCKFKPEDEEPKAGKKKRVQSLCAFSLPKTHDVTEGFWKLVCDMNYDEISSTVKNEKSIMQLGEQIFSEMKRSVKKPDYMRLRQTLREIARLLVEARSSTPIKTVEDFVIPANFSHVVTAVKALAGYDEKSKLFRAPSLALRLGHTLQKISGIIENNARTDGNHSLVEFVHAFRRMYQTRWSESVSTAALASLREAKCNPAPLLPFTEDVKLLHAFLDEKQKEFQSALQLNPTKQNYSDLTMLTLAQVILFNRRRQEDVSKMPLTAFTSREKCKLHDDSGVFISDLEKKLSQHFVMVETLGKDGTKVPVLLTSSMVASMDLLVQNREKCGVSSGNGYMFAQPSVPTFYQGRDCVRHFASKCGAKNPDSLSSETCRERIVVMMNVLHLNESGTDWLADFVGHEIGMLEQCCPPTDDNLELAKLGKLLMAIERGKLLEFSDMKVDDIEIDPKGSYIEYREKNDSTSEPSSEEKSFVSVESTPESEEAEGTKPPLEIKSPKQGALKPRKRRRWESSEVKAVERHMMKFIRTGKLPGKNNCLQCLESEPRALKNRDWLAIKFYVKNRIVASRRWKSS